MRERNFYKRIGLLIGIGIFAVIFYFIFTNLNKLDNVIIPFLIGGLIAYILNPLVVMLEKKLSRTLSIVIIYLLFIIFIFIFMRYFIPVVYDNLVNLIANIPNYNAKYQQIINSVITNVRYSVIPLEIKEIIISQINKNVSFIQGLFLDFLRNSLGLITGIFNFVVNFILGLIIGFYILKDLKYLQTHFSFLIPRRWRDTVNSTLGEINVLISNYLQGQILVAIIVAVLEIIGLTIIGLKYSFVLGLIGGLANIIPYFGPFIGAVPAIAIALLDLSLLKVFLTIIVFVIVQQIDNTFITPRVMSQKVGMHPLMIIFVVLLGGSLFGIPGLIFAVPIAGIIKIIGGKVIEKLVSFKF